MALPCMTLHVTNKLPSPHPKHRVIIMVIIITTRAPADPTRSYPIHMDIHLSLQSSWDQESAYVSIEYIIHVYECGISLLIEFHIKS